MLQKILNFGIFLTFFCLPLYLIRFRLFWVPLNLLEVIIYIVFVLWLIFIFREKKEAKAHKQWLFPVSFIFLGVTVSTLFSSNLSVSAGIWKSWFLAPILLFVVLVNHIKDSKQIKNIILGLTASGVSVAVFSLVYWFRDILTYDDRLRAFYSSPNYLAMYLSPIFILSLWLFSEAGKIENKLRQTASKIALLFVCSLLLFVILLTYSHGAWLGILAGLALSFFGFYRNKKKLPWFFAIGSVLAAFALFIFLINQPSLNSRLVIWRVALRMVKDHPFLGVGPGLFQQYYLSYQIYFPPYLEWAVPQPSNLFLAFWLQTGIIGLVGFIWLLISFFKQLKKAKVDYWLSYVLSSAMLYILIHGLADTTYWKNDLSAIFWLIMGIGVVIGATKGDYGENRRNW